MSVSITIIEDFSNCLRDEYIHKMYWEEAKSHHSYKNIYKIKFNSPGPLGAAHWLPQGELQHFSAPWQS